MATHIIRKPSQRVNIGPGKDTLNDFARKYNLEIEEIYECFNKDVAKKIVFSNTSDYWSTTDTGYKLSVPHNGNIIFAVYKTVGTNKSEQVLTGVSMDSTNVTIEAVEKFSGYMVCAALNNSAKSLLMGEERDAWDAEGFPISNVATPGKVKDATTKEYVDNLIDQLSVEADRYVVFNNVAAMKAADLPAGYNTGTLGYYDINDGGAGIYSIRGKVAGEKEDGRSIIFLDNGNVAEKINSITIKDIVNNMVNNIDMHRFPFVSIAIDGNFASSQGMCVAGDYLIVTHFRSNSTATRYYVIDIPTKTVKGHYDILTNHSNNLTYNADDGCVYTAYGNSVFKMKLTDEGVLSLDQEITVTTLYSISGIAYSNGVFYVRGMRNSGETHRQFYKTEDFVEFEYLYTVDFGMDGQTLQGMEVDDNFLYMPTSGSDYVERIFIFDKITGKRLKVFTIPRKTYGEIEDVDVYNGNIVINFHSSPGAGQTYICPLFVNTSELNPLGSINGATLSTGSDEIYVDNSNILAFPDGTAEHPLNVWQDAVALTAGDNAPYRINISGTYASLTFERRKNLFLNFDNAVITGVLRMTACNNIIITGTWTAKQFYVTTSTVSVGTGGVLEGANASEYPIRLGGASYITGSLTIQNYTKGIMYGGGSVVNISATIINTPYFVPLNTGLSTLIINGNVYNMSAQITSNANLDDYNIPGMKYFCQSSSVAQTVVNSPTTEIFIMENYRCETGEDVMQQVVDVNGNIYVRRSNNGTWTTWKTNSATV